jgi:soluble lytic murein transglycosylase
MTLFLKRLSITVILFIAVALGLSTIGFTLLKFDRFIQLSPLDRVEAALPEIEGLLKVDHARQAMIERIVILIEKYNESMPTGMKHEIASEIYEMEIMYDNLNVNLICATIAHESAATWDPRVVSPKGAMGLMQIMPRTGQFLADYEDLAWTTPEEILFNPIYNVRMGCRYLSSLIDFYGVEGALAAYNGGETRAARWLASNKADGILWKETQHYVPAVMKLYKEFKD